MDRTEAKQLAASITASTKTIWARSVYKLESGDYAIQLVHIPTSRAFTVSTPRDWVQIAPMIKERIG